MDEPLSKKRRLAPKTGQAGRTAGQQSSTTHQAPQSPTALLRPPPPRASEASREEFFGFAQDLQNAAMFFKKRAEQSPHSRVFARMLTWDLPKKHHSHPDCLLRFDDHLAHEYKWNVDSSGMPIDFKTKEVIQNIQEFTKDAGPNDLVVIHYQGDTSITQNGKVFWSYDGRNLVDWDAVRASFQDCVAEVLVFLDCRVPVAAISSVCGKGGMKQILASLRTPKTPWNVSLTKFLYDAFEKYLRLGVSFTTKQLLEEVMKSSALLDEKPVLKTMTLGRFKNLCIGPTTARPANDLAACQDRLVDPRQVADLLFDERVLICTTFLGASNDDLPFLIDKLFPSSLSAMASCVSVEAIFLGPPTTLIISMPQMVYDLLQGNKICLYLGPISSHNLVHLLHGAMAGSAAMHLGQPAPNNNPNNPSNNHANTQPNTQPNGQPNNKANSKPNGHPNNQANSKPNGHPNNQTNSRPCGLPNTHSNNLPVPLRQTNDPITRSPLPTGPSASLAQTTTLNRQKRKHPGQEDSAEMKEAAEQLKALRHVPQRGESSSSLLAPAPPLASAPPSTSAPSLTPAPPQSLLPRPPPLMRTALPDAAPNRCEQVAPPVLSPSSATKAPAAPAMGLFYPLGTTANRPIHTGDLICDMCDHAPFKDSSSLRKHVASVHTRPFPCAFGFAGCASTFGSKNEWKRHMMTQHIASSYYRCSLCPNTRSENREFNRPDLLRSHIRRLHTPQTIKDVGTDHPDRIAWEAHVKDMAPSCLVTRRLPPSRCACPHPHCNVRFQGPTAWTEWNEHVGRHMEQEGCENIGYDPLLVEWALAEGIVERLSSGEMRLTESASSVSPGPGRRRVATVPSMANRAVLTTASSAVSDSGVRPNDTGLNSGMNSGMNGGGLNWGDLNGDMSGGGLSTRLDVANAQRGVEDENANLADAQTALYALNMTMEMPGGRTVERHEGVAQKPAEGVARRSAEGMAQGPVEGVAKRPEGIAERPVKRATEKPVQSATNRPDGATERPVERTTIGSATNRPETATSIERPAQGSKPAEATGPLPISPEGVTSTEGPAQKPTEVTGPLPIPPEGASVTAIRQVIGDPSAKVAPEGKAQKGVELSENGGLLSKNEGTLSVKGSEAMDVDGA